MYGILDYESVLIFLFRKPMEEEEIRMMVYINRSNFFQNIFWSQSENCTQKL